MPHSSYDKLCRRFGRTLHGAALAQASQVLASLDLVSYDLPFSNLGPCFGKLKTTKVAIIGGGFAGMMAAWTLCNTNTGIEVDVFEARPDIGGRVWSNEKFAGGRVIEFGAELVGANHPTWLNMAKKLGVSLITRTSEDEYAQLGLEMVHDIDGKRITPDQGEKLLKDMKSVLTKIGIDARLIADASAPWKQTELAGFDHSVYAKLTTSGNITPFSQGFGLDETSLLFKEVQLLLQNNLVTDLKSMSYLGLLCLVRAGRLGDEKAYSACLKCISGTNCAQYVDCIDPYMGFWEQTEVFRCADGCQSLVKRMEAELTKPTSNYTCKINKNHPVRSITMGPDGDKSITLSASTDRFDYVVLAVPPTVWNSITVTPSSNHPSNVIGTVQTGPALKFFSKFDSRWWIAADANGRFSAPSGISSKVGMIWEGTDNQTMQGGLAKQHLQDIVLSVFSGGPPPAGFRRADANYRRELKRLYTSYKPKANGTQLQDWSIEDYIKTGYSCPDVGYILSKAQLIQQPIAKRLFLAGEHTQTDFFGFMEGALRSGRRVADNIITSVCPGASRPSLPAAEADAILA